MLFCVSKGRDHEILTEAKMMPYGTISGFFFPPPSLTGLDWYGHVAMRKKRKPYSKFQNLGAKNLNFSKKSTLDPNIIVGAWQERQCK
jgi:hypothetical protein